MTATNDAVPEPVRLLTADEVGEILGVNRRAVWRLRNEGRLPAPLNLGKKLWRWRESELLRHIADEQFAPS